MAADSTSGSAAFIEVEQKFLLGPGTAEKLVALGAVLQSDRSFRDQYYDALDLTLTLADHWLRRREGAGWELKCPPKPQDGNGVPDGAAKSPAVGSPGPRPEAPTSDGHQAANRQPLQALEGPGQTQGAVQYLEVTRPQEIVARVCGLLGADPDTVGRDNVGQAVSDLGLKEFASFVTRRCQYRLGGLNVDLDQADFGYAVGEVEALVKRQEEVPEALERIWKLGRQLGFDEKTRIPGKMSAYLHQFRPTHYEALTRLGRLRKMGDGVHGQRNGSEGGWGCS